jgi:hypothetical protein
MSTRRAKRQGTIEEPRGTIQTIIEKVIVNKKTMIITSYICERSITIYIGSYNIYCIDAQIFKDATNKILPDVLLSKIRWDGECSLYDPFESGSDTVMILKLLLTYLKDKYPDIKKVYFTDVSTRHCDNGYPVNLAAMKIFTDGISWYETHFNAKLEDRYKTQYNDMITYANTIKKNTSWESFKNYTYLKNISITEDELITYYNSSNIWQDFFYKIRDKIGVSQYCIWLSEKGWFDAFLFSVLKFNTMSIQYYIEPQLFNISYNIITNKGGRYKSKTLKNRKNR